MISHVTTSFVLGLLTPLSAVCVLPLYPGFIAFLSHKLDKKENRWLPLLLGLVVMSGAIVFMILLGLLFTTILQTSLTSVVNILSPIAFVILMIVSLFLIFNIDMSRFLPKIHSPTLKNPYLSAFGMGFFFGAVALPCNPGFIAVFFARSFLLSNPVTNLLGFVAFGVGLGMPLLLFAALSGTASKQMVRFLVRYRRRINILSGMIMAGVSLYYLLFVFKIF